jgi:hypothetical protein
VYSCIPSVLVLYLSVGGSIYHVDDGTGKCLASINDTVAHDPQSVVKDSHAHFGMVAGIKTNGVRRMANNAARR